MNQIFNILDGPISVIFSFIPLSDFYINNWNLINKISNKCIGKTIPFRKNIESEIDCVYSKSLYNDIVNSKITYNFNNFVCDSTPYDLLIHIVKNHEVRISTVYYAIDKCVIHDKFEDYKIIFPKAPPYPLCPTLKLQTFGKKYYDFITEKCPDLIEFDDIDLCICVQFNDNNILKRIITSQLSYEFNEISLEHLLEFLAKQNNISMIDWLISKYRNLFFDADLSLIINGIGRLPIIKFVCDRLCDIDLSRTSNLILYKAIQYHDIELINFLLENTQILNTINSNIIEICITYRHNKTIKKILKKINHQQINITLLSEYCLKYNNYKAYDILIKTKKISKKNNNDPTTYL